MSQPCQQYYKYDYLEVVALSTDPQNIAQHSVAEVGISKQDITDRPNGFKLLVLSAFNCEA